MVKLGFCESQLRNAGIILTNDGNAILREIDVSHPAAKVWSKPMQQCRSLGPSTDRLASLLLQHAAANFKLDI